MSIASMLEERKPDEMVYKLIRYTNLQYTGAIPRKSFIDATPTNYKFVSDIIAQLSDEDKDTISYTTHYLTQKQMDALKDHGELDQFEFFLGYDYALGKSTAQIGCWTDYLFESYRVPQVKKAMLSIHEYNDMMKIAKEKSQKEGTDYEEELAKLFDGWDEIHG